MKYIKEKVVKECYHQCPFFRTDMDGMKCGHQYFEDKKAYDDMIITQENSRNGKIPEKCPLRTESTEVVLRVELDVNVL